MFFAVPFSGATSDSAQRKSPEPPVAVHPHIICVYSVAGDTFL